MRMEFAPRLIQFAPHYLVSKIESIEELKLIFPDGVADKLNWCFLSTSGIHGTYTALDELNFDDEDCSTEGITVLVVHPRLVVLRYGHFKISREDVPYLRKLVRSTLDAVIKSQQGNV